MKECPKCGSIMADEWKICHNPECFFLVDLAEDLERFVDETDDRDCGDK